MLKLENGHKYQTNTKTLKIPTKDLGFVTIFHSNSFNYFNFII
jgi:hypothetical protein